MDRRISAVELDMENSTAPTTPDGSLTFSPILQAVRLQDALEEEILERRIGPGFESLDRNLSPAPLQVQKICCIGAGYVGGPTAAVMAYHNPHLKVTVVDRDAERIQQWKSKHLPLYEPGLEEILRIARDGTKAITIPAEIENFAMDSLAGSCSTIKHDSSHVGQRKEFHIAARGPNLFFSTEISKCISEADLILIAVNTPTKKKGLGAGRATDMTAVEGVTREIAVHAKAGAILVEKSTVPCRTVDIMKDILKTYRPNTKFEILSNPEFLSAGTGISDLMYPSRVLIGSQPTPSGNLASLALENVYSWVHQANILHTNIYSSELAKLVANAMLAQRISSINSISAICEKTGADVDELSAAVRADPRIGSQYLKAGVGFGGSCFGKDIRSLVYMADSLGLPDVAEYWQQVLKVNEWQLSRFARRIIRKLNGTLRAKKIAVLGYAFKAGTDDTRESPALEAIRILLEDEPREISIFDPYCKMETVREEIGRLCGVDTLRENGGPVVVHDNAYETCSGSHAVLIMTDCDEFTNFQVLSQNLQRGRFEDPRPFYCTPSESDILSLQKSLTLSIGSQDPLLRYNEEPKCPPGCLECLLVKESKSKPDHSKERLDWARIAYHLEEPKWVFDGRGVLQPVEMAKLGVRVEGIGKAGWS